MKTAKITTLLLFLSFQLHAQNIENPSFDSVYLGGIDRLHAWITSDAWMGASGDTILPLTPLTHFVSVGLQYHELLYSAQLDYSTAFDGPYAIKLLSDSTRIRSDGSAFRGFIVNGDHFYTDSTGYIDLSKCGTPFTYRPYKLMGHYKFEDFSPSLHNYPLAVVLLKKYNATTQTSDTIGIATASMQLFGINTWRYFEMPVNYFSNQVPDSIVVAFLSAGLAFPSTFWVDSLGFDYTFPTGITSDENNFSDKAFYQNSDENTIHLLNDESIRSVMIYSVDGKLVLTTSSPVTVLDISFLKAGNYLMKIEYRDNKKRTYKISRKAE